MLHLGPIKRCELVAHGALQRTSLEPSVIPLSYSGVALPPLLSYHFEETLMYLRSTPITMDSLQVLAHLNDFTHLLRNVLSILHHTSPPR